MAYSFRPNRYLAPSLRGQRAVEAEEQRMREQILREKAKAVARKAASEQNKSTNAGGEQSFQQPPSK
jgi:hypothetical protein